MRNLSHKNILVTGGAGFVGSHLIDFLLTSTDCCTVVSLDSLFNGSQANLELAQSFTGRFFSVVDDLEIYSSLAYVIERYNIDYAFNLATKPLNYSFVNPSNCFSTNTVGLLNLLELLRGNKFSGLCHFSSSEVFGSSGETTLDERTRFNPLTPYAAGKAASDLLINSYRSTFDLDVFTVRPFNLFGPRQQVAPPLAALIPRTIDLILSGNSPIISGSGHQSRDFNFVLDVVAAAVQLFVLDPSVPVVNICSGHQQSVLDVVSQISRHLNYDLSSLQFTTARTADVTSHNATNALLNSYIDYIPTPFPQALSSTIDWYQESAFHVS